MATFRDSVGREWLVSIETLQLRRVREATGFELAKLLDDKMRRLHELAADPELLCRVLFALCSKQHAEVTEDQLFAAMGGDQLEPAFDAFIRAYADFCPSQRRALLLTLVAKEKELATAVTAKGLAELEALDVGEVMATLNKPVGVSPESSELTPPG